MRHVVEVVVLVDVDADSALDLRMALALLRREAPHVESMCAGHAAGFGPSGFARPGHDYTFRLKSRKRASSVRVAKGGVK